MGEELDDGTDGIPLMKYGLPETPGTRGREEGWFAPAVRGGVVPDK